MRIPPKYIQLAVDAIIPLAGIFLWDWGLYFILLFYALDLIASEVIIQLKSNKIIEFSEKESKKRIAYTVQSILLLIVILGCIHIAMLFIQPGINFQQELIDFWTYEDLGIQQGYILLPLVALAAFQQYRMFFLMPAAYRKLTLDDVWKPHIKSFLLILASSGVAIGFSQFISIPELVYVLLIVAGTSVYQLFRK